MKDIKRYDSQDVTVQYNGVAVDLIVETEILNVATMGKPDAELKGNKSIIYSESKQVVLDPELRGLAIEKVK